MVITPLACWYRWEVHFWPGLLASESQSLCLPSCCKIIVQVTLHSQKDFKSSCFLNHNEWDQTKRIGRPSLAVECCWVLLLCCWDLQLSFASVALRSFAAKCWWVVLLCCGFLLSFAEFRFWVLLSIAVGLKSFAGLCSRFAEFCCWVLLSLAVEFCWVSLLSFEEFCYWVLLRCALALLSFAVESCWVLLLNFAVAEFCCRVLLSCSTVFAEFCWWVLLSFAIVLPSLAVEFCWELLLVCWWIVGTKKPTV